MIARLPHKLLSLPYEDTKTTAQNCVNKLSRTNVYERTYREAVKSQDTRNLSKWQRKHTKQSYKPGKDVGKDYFTPISHKVVCKRTNQKLQLQSERSRNDAYLSAAPVAEASVRRVDATAFGARQHSVILLAARGHSFVYDRLAHKTDIIIEHRLRYAMACAFNFNLQSRLHRKY